MNSLPEYYQQVFSDLHIGVLGDYALDVYYQRQRSTGEISLETSLEVWHGKQIRTSPGGAANVVNNLKALDIGKISCFGVLGKDVWGRELKYLLSAPSVCLEGLLENSLWESCAYVKPFEEDTESHRVDFGHVDAELTLIRKEVLNKLNKQLPKLDALIINQQFPNPLINHAFLTELNNSLLEYPSCLVIADLRNFGSVFKQGILKANAEEMANILSIDINDVLAYSASTSNAIKVFCRDNSVAVLLSLGSLGLRFISSEEDHFSPGVSISAPIDTVGAGDTVVASFAACMASRHSVMDAMNFANMAAAVTIQKIGITGTASLEELSALSQKLKKEVKMTKKPEPQSLKSIEHSLREEGMVWLNSSLQNNLPLDLKYAMIDHDGTLSLLRKGWQPIMHAFWQEIYQVIFPAKMLEETQLNSLTTSTTGMPTLRQMEIFKDKYLQGASIGLGKYADPVFLKNEFVKRLEEVVNKRKAEILADSSKAGGYRLPDSLKLLNFLTSRGIHLHLASGTDERSVLLDTELLGYSQFFGENIWGARELDWDAKEAVLSEWKEKGAKSGQVMVIGDGPREIEAALTSAVLRIGVVMDEENPLKPDMNKAQSLIEAGANGLVLSYRYLIAHLEGMIKG